MEGQGGLSPKSAFDKLAAEFGKPDLPKYFSAIREAKAPAQPSPEEAIASVIEVAAAMRARVERL
jgi:hypothetical protein